MQYGLSKTGQSFFFFRPLTIFLQSGKPVPSYMEAEMSFEKWAADAGLDQNRIDVFIVEYYRNFQKHASEQEQSFGEWLQDYYDLEYVIEERIMEKP